MTESSSQSRRSFGDYDLVRELGRGGMGLVYEAHERALDRRVALKVLPKELAHDASYAQRFLNEARAAARLNHPNIVTIHAVGQVNDRHYIAMELVEGVSLSAWVKKHGPMDAQQALGLIRQVAEALAEAHRRGIIHRDIKPQNIMVDETGRVKVLDFGLAKVLESASELTAQGSQLGTPRYMAPEQIHGKQVDARSDIYSLGVVLYELLAGRVAIEGDSPMTVMYKIVHEPFPDITQSNPRVPLPVVQVLQKMTAREPERRPQTAPELIQVIDGARAGRVVFENVLGQPGAPRFGGQEDAPLLDDRLRTEITGISLAPAGQPKNLKREFPFYRVLVAAGIVVSSALMGYAAYRSIPNSPSFESASEREEGWIELFNGHDLQGWSVPPTRQQSGQWFVQDRAITCTDKRSYLQTDQQWEDFELTLEYKLKPASNGGIFLRGRVEVTISDELISEPEKGGYLMASQLVGSMWKLDGVLIHFAPDGNLILNERDDGSWSLGTHSLDMSGLGTSIRAQIDDYGIVTYEGKPVNQHRYPMSWRNGGLWNLRAPDLDASNPPGEWNSVEIWLVGGFASVAVNGRLIHDKVNLSSAPVQDIVSGTFGDPGPIVLQNWYGQVWYRNIRIRPL